MKMKIFAMILGIMMVAGLAQARHINYDPNIRVVHGSFDAGDVDVFIDGKEVLSMVPFAGASEFMEVERDEYNIQVKSSLDNDVVPIDEDLRFKARQFYTIIAAGPIDEIQSVLIEDKYIPIRPNHAVVRFFHGVYDAPDVDVRIKDGSKLFRRFSYLEEIDKDDYKKVTPGTYDLEILLSGTRTVVKTIENVELQKGYTYTIIAAGEAGDIVPIVMTDKVARSVLRNN